MLGGEESDACGVPEAEGGAPDRGPDFPGLDSVLSSLSFPGKRRAREGGLHPPVYKDSASVEVTGGGVSLWLEKRLVFLPEWEPLTSGLSLPHAHRF